MTTRFSNEYTVEGREQSSAADGNARLQASVHTLACVP
jgi:hypothetical protein